MEDTNRLYGDLAPWWPLLSAPEEYAEEAEVYRRVLVAAADIPVREVLELGSGGGNNASHLEADFTMTLVDRSPAMLDVSRALNPELEHVEGDMRTVRLGREFDAVFIHDAICYITAEEDLAAVAATARAHCRPGGVALLVPDDVAETFRPGTEHGGHDGDGRAARYLEWTHEPDPNDTVSPTTWSTYCATATRFRWSMSATCSGCSPPGSGSPLWKLPGSEPGSRRWS
jgi:SAM-dependent methyltransferase